jgi:hypothetical protein
MPASVKSFRENVPQKDSSLSQQATYTSLGIGPGSRVINPLGGKCSCSNFAVNHDRLPGASLGLFGLRFRVTGSNGTKSSAKAFSFVDRSDSSRVKSDRGHHHRGVAPERAAQSGE